MERIQFLNIGYGNVVSANRVIAIISPDSAPVKRIIQEAKEKGNLIDATYGPICPKPSADALRQNKRGV